MCIGTVCVFRIRITNKKLRGLAYPSEAPGVARWHGPCTHSQAYTSVVAIAITSSAGPLPKNVSEDDLRSDQIAIEQRDDQREGSGQKA